MYSAASIIRSNLRRWITEFQIDYLFRIFVGAFYIYNNDQNPPDVSLHAVLDSKGNRVRFFASLKGKSINAWYNVAKEVKEIKFVNFGGAGSFCGAVGQSKRTFELLRFRWILVLFSVYVLADELQLGTWFKKVQA
jgi:hypothetical protein